ncbi:MAG TPA: lysophospholipid acyltransferase family protein [Thermoanaerobaculia bacterium]|nr:lysophospholipid acyltransferase family protein [Thermoanaerobaculia bacterium]
MRRFIVRLFRLAIEVFYRRVEIVGVEHVPRDAPVIFAVNHPNGLIDPLFLLCYAPRDVSFLAKAPLFRYPLIGWFAKLFDSIPVYRKQDNVAGSNEETFARARAILERGGGVAIFPEGTTHSDARLRELKTGAARIALGASLADLAIVPVGIYYSAKGTFRSDALVLFGTPMDVRSESTVEELTRDIERGLAAVTLQADSRAALELVEQAEDIFSERTGVAGEFALRKQFVEGYHYLSEHDPQRLARLASEVTRFAEELRRAKLEPHELVLRVRASTIVRVVVQLPIAAAGALLHYPTYRLVGFLAKRFARGETELMATIKFIGSLLLYPLTWIVYGVVAYHYFGVIAAIATLLLVPLLGFEAYRIFETADVLAGRLRAMRRRDLVAAREALRDEFLAVARDIIVAPNIPERKERSP